MRDRSGEGGVLSWQSLVFRGGWRRREFCGGFGVGKQSGAERGVVRQAIREHDRVDVQRVREEQTKTEKGVLDATFVVAADAIHRVVVPDFDRRSEVLEIMARFVEQEAKRTLQFIRQQIDPRLELLALRDPPGPAAHHVEESERESARRNVGGAIAPGETTNERIFRSAAQSSLTALTMRLTSR